MSKLFVLGLHSEREAILDALHARGVVEICEPELEQEQFVESTRSIAQFERYVVAAESALAVLDHYAPEGTGLIAARRLLPIEKYQVSSVDYDATILRSIDHIIGLSDKIREHTESIRLLTAKQIALEPYLNLDLPMSLRGTSNTIIKVGLLGGLWPAERLQKELDEEGLKTLHFEILSTTRENTYVWIVYSKTKEQAAKAFLQRTGFSDPNFSLPDSTPREEIKTLDGMIGSLNDEIKRCVSNIVDFTQARRDIEFFYDHLSLRKDKYQVLAKLDMTEHTFALNGYIPTRYVQSIKTMLEDKWTVLVEVTEPDSPDDVPIVFHNNAFVSPVEEITETYSMPSPNDIDPNPVMAVFYYLFFGMMFSDAGYGLLLALVCGYLGFSNRLEKPKRRNYQMFFYCGLSTVFWGLMYGSFFGDIINTVSVAFFGKTIAFDPIWLNPLKDAMSLLLFSVAFGVVQILVGLGIGFYTLARQGRIWDALFDIGFWMVTLVGLCVLAVGIGLGNTMFSTAGQAVSIFGAVGLVLTGGRQSKNPIVKLFSGVVGLYGITGYITDALSYSRLMALGLATGSIANVVNMLAAMHGNSFVGILLFVLIAVFGHSMNFAMNMLGAYVHTNRLQYVEFFSKFYEGGGRAFSPFSMHTKFYQFLDG